MTSNFDPNKAENLEDIEKQFAVKAVVQAEAYWSLISKVKASSLRLTNYDNEIFDTLLTDFPELSNKEAVAEINEDAMKSKQGKERWRNFCEKFKEIDDYNFGTLLRTKCSGEYSEQNTIFAVRIQFYAIEIARNRYGLNDWASGN